MLAALLATLMGSPNTAFAGSTTECEPVEKKKVKIEGYISKKFRKQIFKEFGEMGYTRVALKVYPMGETSKVLAIGRCVPAYLARHIILKSRQYSTGVQYLVQQQFLSSHWFGVGATIFVPFFGLQVPNAKKAVD
jgi:hypothetical protein